MIQESKLFHKVFLILFGITLHFPLLLNTGQFWDGALLIDFFTEQRPELVKIWFIQASPPQNYYFHGHYPIMCVNEL